MSFLINIYKNVPAPVQNIMVSVYGYGWKKRRFGGVFEDELKGFKTRENFNSTQWNDYQTISLRKLLVHSYNTVPFYKKKFSQLQLSLTDLQKIELQSIKQIPILEKDELRKFGTTDLLSSQKLKGNFFSSSGSTGTPTKIYFSEQMHQKWSAGFEARIRNWAGLNHFNSRGMIGGRRVLPDGQSKPPYYRYNIFEKQVYFSAYHISKSTADNYVDAIKKYKLDYMTGYAMSNYFLAYFINELSLNAPQLKAVITSSEKLTDDMRSLFKKVYGCHTFDSWSGVEACGLISECEHGGLHMNPDIGLLEVLREDGTDALPGEIGQLVCTGFVNYDQPLIRYKIGDNVKLSAQVCSCGRQMQLVDEIIGRTEDVIIGKDGRKMVRFHGIFIDIFSIIRGQIIQEDMDNITMKVVVSASLSTKEKNVITHRMISQLGQVNVKIDEVDDIPLTANGKFKAVISKIKSSN